jgi:hypothetical protein
MGVDALAKEGDGNQSDWRESLRRDETKVEFEMAFEMALINC